MTKSLLSLAGEFAQIDKMLIESNGEITPEIETYFALTEGNSTELAIKIDRYKYYMDHLDFRMQYFKDLEEQAKQVRKLFENKKDALKERLSLAMQTLQVDELQGQDWRFKRSNAQPKLIIDDESRIPDLFIDEVVTKVIRKDEIKEALKYNPYVPGAHLEASSSLRCYANTEKLIK